MSEGKIEPLDIAKRFEWLQAVVSHAPRVTMYEMGVAVVACRLYDRRRGRVCIATRAFEELSRVPRPGVVRAIAALKERGFLEQVPSGRRENAYLLTFPANYVRRLDPYEV